MLSSNDPQRRNIPQSLLDDLRATVEKIATQDPAAAGPLWGAAHKLLLKAKAASNEVALLVTSRDVPGLELLVRRLRGEEPAERVDEAPTPPSSAAPTVDPEIMKRALRMFRNRIKFLRLDLESSLSSGPMTSGKQHAFDAIEPPHDYDLAVWEALADAGKLRRAGPGFYSLADEPEKRTR